MARWRGSTRVEVRSNPRSPVSWGGPWPTQTPLS
jgi:hypothetical protein